MKVCVWTQHALYDYEIYFVLCDKYGSDMMGPILWLAYEQVLENMEIIYYQ